MGHDLSERQESLPVKLVDGATCGNAWAVEPYVITKGRYKTTL